jgi:uncharacterized protein HemX
MKTARVLAFVLVGIGAITSAVVFGQVRDQSAELMDQYRKAQKDEDKKEIRKKLADELGKQFDAHMEQQQKELAALEKQINELKNIMKKRQEAKTTIIDRRIDQLSQDAEGLGWTAPGSPQHVGLWGRPTPYYRSSSATDSVPVGANRAPIKVEH